jgi:hypothetical protein
MSSDSTVLALKQKMPPVEVPLKRTNGQHIQNMKAESMVNFVI